MNLKKKQTMSRLVSIVVIIVTFGIAELGLAQQGPGSLIVIFGDSITAGENTSFAAIHNPGRRARGIGGGATNFSTPDRSLTTILSNSRRTAKVVNWGHGGTPTGPGSPNDPSNGLGRISSNLQSTANSNSEYDCPAKCYVLILYGTNDPDFGIPISATGDYIRMMIDRARARQFTPVVASLLPRSSRSVTSRNTAIRNAALSRGAAFVDQHALFNAQGGTSLHDPVYDNGRLLHPSEAGYQVVAQNWFSAFLESAIEPEITNISSIIFLLLDD